MHSHHSVFIDALHNRLCIELRFRSKEDSAVLVRRCAPMDFGPSRRAHNQADRYHLWDYDSDTGRHTLSLLPAQVLSMIATKQYFDPAEFVTWSLATSPWYLERDWGAFS